MFGWGKKKADEEVIGVWVDTDSKEADYSYGFGDTPWGRTGSRENAQKLLDLTDDEMAALDEYGSIDKDIDGTTVSIETGWGW
jgi:hypothetical protein